MVDFRRNSTGKAAPRNFLARREQRRLLLLVMSLGLVILLISEARKPATWDRVLTALTGPDAGGQAAVPENRDYDTRVRPTSPEQLPLDTFISEAPKQNKTDISGRFFPGVEPEHLQDIRDNTIFRSSERESWYNLLDVLQETDQQKLDENTTGQVGFAQLFEQPDQYRGQVVTIRGTARQALAKPARKNAQGIEGYHRVVLHPSGGPPRPIVIYTLGLPEGFPTGESIRENVEITGFFYKNWAYPTNHPDPAQRTVLTAPLVLAKTVDWRPPPPIAGDDDVYDPIFLALAVAGTALFGIFAAVWIYRRSNLIVPGRARTAYDVDALRGLEHQDLGPGVDDSLRKLSIYDGDEQHPDR